jgi:diguanylate cyclase (GGDEF)-like protein
LLILAAFSAIVALLNREPTFLLFSAWLVLSLRIAAVNGGWDKYWLKQEFDNELYLTLLRATIAAYAYFTVSLYRSLLAKRGDSVLVRRYFLAFQHCFFVFIVAAPFFEHLAYLRAFWTFAAFGLGALTLQIGYLLYTQRTRIVAWYALSWASMVVGMASEIGAQSGVVGYPAWINSQTASVVSALMMGIALADRLRSERDGRLAAQAKSLTYLKKYEENYNSMPVGLFGLSDSGTVRISNPAFAAMFTSRNQDAAITGHIDTLLGDGSFERIRSATRSGGKEIELSLTSPDGKDHWFLVRVAAKESTIEGSIQDVTTRKLAEDKLKHLVDHDSLTGLLNRRGLDASLMQVAELVKGGTRCAIAYVDLDRFKLINDLHGHGTGDALLQQAGRRLHSAARSGDLVARLADAFVVLFVDCPDYAVAGLTERIRAAIGTEPFEIEGKGLNMTASVGVVSIEPTMSTIDAVAAADRACLEAKARGRNCVVRLTDQDSELRTHLEELRVVADLQQRIATDKYFLEFQPIVALRSAMSSLSYEVLIRMRGDDGKVVPPGKFIGAAERNGLMSQIDRWVLRSTLEWLDGHPEHRDRLSFATINISGASLNDTRFVDDAFAMIADHPLAMPKLCFEITESVALHDLGSTRRFVDRVRMYGSKLALDDFGAGYTSFNYLKEIPADFIKIDGSFVKDINRNPANYAITRTIVELTHELGMRSIAEWAETPDTIASLYDLGVDYGQGFGLVRPIAPDLVAAASSGGALVRDPQVIALLNDRTRPAPLSRVRRATQRDLG